MESAEHELLRRAAERDAQIRAHDSELERRSIAKQKSKARDEFGIAQEELASLRGRIRKFRFLRAIPEFLFLGSVYLVLVMVVPPSLSHVLPIIGVVVALYFQIGYLGWWKKELELERQLDSAESRLWKAGEAAGIETMLNRHPPKPRNSFTVLGIKLSSKRTDRLPDE